MLVLMEAGRKPHPMEGKMESFRHAYEEFMEQMIKCIEGKIECYKHSKGEWTEEIAKAKKELALYKSELDKFREFCGSKGIEEDLE